MVEPDLQYPFTTFNFSIEITVPGISVSSSNGQDQNASSDGGPAGQGANAGSGGDSAGKAGFICKASFAECDGLEMTLEPKTIREGGNNVTAIHLTGPVSYAQLTLKRGMTDQSKQLWQWFDRVTQAEFSGLRADGMVVMWTPARQPQAIFDLTGCLPIKLKVPPLNAGSGGVAIEEMQLVYERLSLRGSSGETEQGES